MARTVLKMIHFLLLFWKMRELNLPLLDNVFLVQSYHSWSHVIRISIKIDVGNHQSLVCRNERVSSALRMKCVTGQKKVLLSGEPYLSTDSNDVDIDLRVGWGQWIKP